MIKYYGISFKNDGKIYYFKSDINSIPLNTNVIVETERGKQFGKVKSELDETKIKINLEEIKNVLRIASDEDYKQYMDNLKEASEAANKANQYAKELDLKMKFIDGVFTFDKKQLLLNFLADERIDFRELARKLALAYKTRIELRQIGARDKAKEIGGIGPCGRKLCCSQFLHHMDSITMNMAKNQNLSLNPAKINGCCGRLLCCLSYEDEEYARCQKGLPYVGQTVTTKYGKGRVINVDILGRKFLINIDDEIREVIVDSNEQS